MPTFFQTVTAPQAELVSAAGGVVSVLLAAILAPLVFHLITRKGVADFKSAIDDVTTSANTVRNRTTSMGSEIEKLGEKLVEINALLSALQMNQAISQSRSEEEERAIDALVPDARNSQQDAARTRLKDLWSRIRNRLENVASDSSIDGRTRARYARIDRRDYRELVNTLSSEGRLGDDKEDWLKAVFIWYQHRPNNQDIDPTILDELGKLAGRLESAKYEQPETDNLGLADKVRRDACDGKLPTPLTAAVVREHYPGYAQTAAQTVLANYCEGGLWHSRGQPARFRRIAQGEYTAMCDETFVRF